MLESTTSLTPSNAVALLRKEGCDNRLLSHVKTVSKLARKIAARIKDKGYDIDVDFVEVAALLHDIGRTRTHGIRHGIEGASILRKMSLERYARVCETHIGAGLTGEEAESLGLPVKDYLPETLEEKVIAHADNLIEGSKVVSIEKTLDRLEKELGVGHSAVERVKELNDLIVSIS